jgi:hypothetical protein
MRLGITSRCRREGARVREDPLGPRKGGMGSKNPGLLFCGKSAFSVALPFAELSHANPKMGRSQQRENRERSKPFGL